MPAPTSPLVLSTDQKALLDSFDASLNDAFGVGVQVGSSIVEQPLQIYGDDSKMAVPSTGVTADQQRDNIRQAFRHAAASLIATGTTPSSTFTDTTGTPGSATANSLTGRSSVASGQTTATVTDSRVTSQSVVSVTPESLQGTHLSWSVVPAAGSFTVTIDAAAVSDWVFRWAVSN